ncbi:MAG TPA: hypothetical protein VIT18_08610, partial [Terrimicrobiaceae bacterium]
VVRWLKEHYPHLEVHHVEHSPGTGYYGLPRNPEKKRLEFLAVGTIGHRKGTDLLLMALDELKQEIDFHLRADEMEGAQSAGGPVALSRKANDNESALPSESSRSLANLPVYSR